MTTNASFGRAAARPGDDARDNRHDVADAYITASVGECVATALAVSLALLVVVVMAVLMGSVGP